MTPETADFLVFIVTSVHYKYTPIRSGGYRSFWPLKNGLTTLNPSGHCAKFNWQHLSMGVIQSGGSLPKKSQPRLADSPGVDLATSPGCGAVEIVTGRKSTVTKAVCPRIYPFRAG